MSTKHTKGVLDLTFMDIENEETLGTQIRNESVKQIRSPMKTRSASKSLGATEVSAFPEEITAVRLSNNKLDSMEQLVAPMLANIDTSKILWLDLSFNQLTSLGNGEIVPGAFPNVTTIYLHANKISKLAQLKKLKNFPNLKSLSLYGNPIEEHKHYRNYVMYMCPNLHQFDSSPLTSSEKTKNLVWAQTFRKVLNKEEDDW